VLNELITHSDRLPSFAFSAINTDLEAYLGRAFGEEPRLRFYPHEIRTEPAFRDL
jgi:hypothetical protein